MTLYYVHPRGHRLHQHHQRAERRAEKSCGFLNGSEEDTSLSSPSQDSYAHVSCQTCPKALYNRNTSFSHAQESSVKTETGTKWKTTIEEVKDEESTPSGHFQPHQEQKRTEPFSSLWILSRLQDLAAEAGIGTLKQWVHNQKQREVNKDLVQLLLNIPTNEALDWLEDEVL